MPVELTFWRTQRKIMIMKLELIARVSVNKFYVWFFPTDFLIKRKECDANS